MCRDTNSGMQYFGLIFTNDFILVRLVMDSELIPGMLRCKFTVNGSSVYLGHHIHTYGKFYIPNPPTGMFSRGWGETGESRGNPSRKSSGSNSCSCEEPKYTDKLIAETAVIYSFFPFNQVFYEIFFPPLRRKI